MSYTDSMLLSNLKNYQYVIFYSNGSLKKDGSNVMGHGIGRTIKQLIPSSVFAFGNHIKQNGNVPLKFQLMGVNYISMPTKTNYWENDDFVLTRQSISKIMDMGISGKIVVELPQTIDHTEFMETWKTYDLSNLDITFFKT